MRYQNTKNYITGVYKTLKDKSFILISIIYYVNFLLIYFYVFFCHSNKTADSFFTLYSYMNVFIYISAAIGSLPSFTAVTILL